MAAATSLAAPVLSAAIEDSCHSAVSWWPKASSFRAVPDRREQLFIAGSDPAEVTDLEGRQRADKATGETLWGLDLVALDGKDGAEVWRGWARRCSP